MATEETETSLLIVVVDVNPAQRILVEQRHRLSQCLDAIVAFSNSHLMLKSTNKLAVLACNADGSEFVYPNEDKSASAVRQQDGQYELFTHTEKTIRHGLQQFVLRNTNSVTAESLLAGAFAMALCYIHRLERELSAGVKMNSRILVITGSGDSASQYMNYMNVFFTAQKQNVILDVCSLDQNLGLLQQGCDITGGLYLKLTVPRLPGLLQYLLWVFLPEPPIRKKLVLPPPVKVDYRAACFCHRQLVDIGYVCSICLSIFCKFSPICTTCHAVFKTPGALPVKPKKKKPKLM
ncbi:general transcription factor IIH subunit 3 [Macrosteles quadrilineatus]|uniref:general transcription factor IIH subunit 3 n=1 Tax=Macrosteles quadrilineatus TaxID=74068 RepID=UPI0023E0F22E|nr:general transcription factor IIH subunit 3 [Macrosteles quadrilineatus]